MPAKVQKHGQLIKHLNQALGWELRAQAIYAHYAAYVKGLEMLTLTDHFEEEVTESLGHAKKVRDIIADLDGEAVTTRDPAPIVHTEDVRVMLEEALKTEQKAAAAYHKMLPLTRGLPVYEHTLRHIMLDEMKSVVEMQNLLGR
jgi:bacterioferritin (cytochrome b1)